MNHIKYIPVVILLVSLMNCDLEKFTGYNHEADPIPDAARFYGKITNKFTSEPVNDAVISIADQATFSDEDGIFEFYYHLAEDDARNKPVRMRITARNYLPIDTNIVVFPENEIIKGMAYAAPIIKRIARVDSVFQAEIYDYQGWQDMVDVYGEFFYVRGDERVIALTTRIPMQRVGVDTPNTAYYQGFVKTSISGFGSLIAGFNVYARDRLGYADSTNNTKKGQISLLFPPIYD